MVSKPLLEIDRHEEQLVEHSKNLDLLNQVVNEEPEDDDDPEDGIERIFRAIQKNNLAQCNFQSIIRLLHTQINIIARDITRLKKKAAQQKKNDYVQFGDKDQLANNVKANNAYKKDIEKISRQGMELRIVSLE